MVDADPADHTTVPPRSLHLISSPTEALSHTSRTELRVLYTLFCHGRPLNKSSPTKAYLQSVGFEWWEQTPRGRSTNSLLRATPRPSDSYPTGHQIPALLNKKAMELFFYFLS